MKTPLRSIGLALMFCALTLLAVSAYAQVSGAIFTSLGDGTTVNANLYNAKTDVYLNGGPQNKNSAGLTDGTYYFQVTDPSGATLLSSDSAVCRQVLVSGGVIAGATGPCPHANGTFNPANGQQPVQLVPFDDTPNNGGEYKVWLIAQTSRTSIDPNNPAVLIFDGRDVKTDNFKIRKPELGYLVVCKYNDMNGNGTQDQDEPFIPGWPITATFANDPNNPVTQNTDQDGCTSFSSTSTVSVTLTEGSKDNWIQTAPLGNDGVTVLTSETATITPPSTTNAPNFGNRQVKALVAPIPTKDAAGSYKDTFVWNIQKAVDKTLVKQVGGSATFNYTVTVGHDGGTISDVKVTGAITITNTNQFDIKVASIGDKLSDNTVCSVMLPQGVTLPVTVPANGGEVQAQYSCSLGAVPESELDNTVTIGWDKQTFSGTDALYVLDAGTADMTVQNISFTAALVDDNATITDTFAGTLGTVNVNDANPSTFTYQRVITVPAFNCQSYDNTATFTTDDTGTTGNDSKSVTVCGPLKTGALTIGFWQNKNGQGIIKAGSSLSGVCKSGTWLRQYPPFQDLSATASCTTVASYVYNVIKAANASGASMNAMLKAQMLATALDVYFSDPALGGNKILALNPIGSAVVDLTMICNSPGSCSVYLNVSSAFGGATSLTIQQILTYAGSQSNAGGSFWYGNIKSVQELAKDTFDAINNQKVF